MRDLPIAGCHSTRNSCSWAQPGCTTGTPGCRRAERCSPPAGSSQAAGPGPGCAARAGCGRCRTAAVWRGLAGCGRRLQLLNLGLQLLVSGPQSDIYATRLPANSREKRCRPKPYAQNVILPRARLLPPRREFCRGTPVRRRAMHSALTSVSMRYGHQRPAFWTARTKVATPSSPPGPSAPRRRHGGAYG